MSVATTSAPTSAPTSGLSATSSPATAPVKASSLVPWTAKAMERVMTKGPMRPQLTATRNGRLERVLGEAELEVEADAHQCGALCMRGARGRPGSVGSSSSALTTR